MLKSKFAGDQQAQAERANPSGKSVTTSNTQSIATLQAAVTAQVQLCTHFCSTFPVHFF